MTPSGKACSVCHLNSFQWPAFYGSFTLLFCKRGKLPASERAAPHVLEALVSQHLAAEDSVAAVKALESALEVKFRRSFGPHKCCHPQISDLGFIISWWQLSCEILLQILTSLELHSNSANRPGILLSHDGSPEVNLLMIFLELSLKKTSRVTKSDIWG